MSEEWRPCHGFEAHYSVSSQGRVRRDANGPGARPGHCLSLTADHAGYLQVYLSVEGKVVTKKVHRLVATTFNGIPTIGRPEVNHLNGIKTDNRPSNLNWCSRAENLQHARDTGLARFAYGESSGNSKLTESGVREIRRLAAEGVQKATLARRFSISRGTVYQVLNRTTWKHVGG